MKTSVFRVSEVLNSEQPSPGVCACMCSWNLHTLCASHLINIKNYVLCAKNELKCAKKKKKKMCVNVNNSCVSKNSNI